MIELLFVHTWSVECSLWCCVTLTDCAEDTQGQWGFGFLCLQH